MTSRTSRARASNMLKVYHWSCMPKAEQLRVRRPDDTLAEIGRSQTVLRFQEQPVGQEREVVQVAGAQDDCIDMRACAVPEGGGIPPDRLQRRHFFAGLRPGMAHHRRAVRHGHRRAAEFAALRSDVFPRMEGADDQDVPARKFARVAEVMACRVRPLKVSRPGNPGTFGVQKWPDATTTWSNSSQQTWSFFRSWTVSVNLPVAASWALCGTGVRDQIRGGAPRPALPGLRYSQTAPRGADSCPSVCRNAPRRCHRQIPALPSGPSTKGSRLSGHGQVCQVHPGRSARCSSETRPGGPAFRIT